MEKVTNKLGLVKTSLTSIVLSYCRLIKLNKNNIVVILIDYAYNTNIFEIIFLSSTASGLLIV